MMATETMNDPDPEAAVGADELSQLIARYGCGPVAFSGSGNALYERHLVFDDVVAVADAGPRER